MSFLICPWIVVLKLLHELESHESLVTTSIAGFHSQSLWLSKRGHRICTSVKFLNDDVNADDLGMIPWESVLQSLLLKVWSTDQQYSVSGEFVRNAEFHTLWICILTWLQGESFIHDSHRNSNKGIFLHFRWHSSNTLLSMDFHLHIDKILNPY